MAGTSCVVIAGKAMHTFGGRSSDGEGQLMIGGSSILSTLHTLDAAETVIHMFDLFPPHERLQVRAAIAMLAGTLKGIIGQRLIRTKDGKSRVAVCEVIVTTERTKGFTMDPQQAGPIQTAIAEGEYYGM